MDRLVDQDASKLRILVDINVNLAAALRESQKTGEPIKPVQVAQSPVATGVTVSV